MQIKNNENKNACPAKLLRSGGYTLIETMICISLFAIIVTAGMGALLNADRLHNKSKDMRSILDNLSFVMDDMSRNLRTGYNYQCFDSTHPTVSLFTTSAGYSVGPPPTYPSRSCANGWAIAFEPSGGNVLTYGNPNGGSLPADQWAYTITGGKIYKSIDGGQTFIQLSPNEVTIDQVNAFSVLGAESPTATPPDYQQPFITIRLVGHITYQNFNTPFSLQTSVSQRQIDIGS